MHVKNIANVTFDDWIRFPVWEFTNEDEGADDLLMRPVIERPVSDMSGRLVSTRVRLANGTRVLAVVGDLDLKNYDVTKHFLTISVFRGNEQLLMARYYDVDWSVNGPRALASFLGLSIEAVFPIYYDIRDVCVGDDRVTQGLITAEPSDRLTKDQLLKLALR